ncbi:hypothetical protein JOL62DRAFT_331862 [Phyllosticta paracitricarpa]|uniref:Uncharacterized protein n=2 Tax=Phyllosticta TaxID=121621 RepID=A0ABR1M1T6_9PEZI
MRPITTRRRGRAGRWARRTRAVWPLSPSVSPAATTLGRAVSHWFVPSTQKSSTPSLSQPKPPIDYVASRSPTIISFSQRAVLFQLFVSLRRLISPVRTPSVATRVGPPGHLLDRADGRKELASADAEEINYLTPRAHDNPTLKGLFLRCGIFFSLACLCRF